MQKWYWSSLILFYNSPCFLITDCDKWSYMFQICQGICAVCCSWDITKSVYVILRQRENINLMKIYFVLWLVALISAIVWLYLKPNTICKTCQYPSKLIHARKVWASVKTVNRVILGTELGALGFFLVFQLHASWRNRIHGEDKKIVGLLLVRSYI